MKNLLHSKRIRMHIIRQHFFLSMVFFLNVNTMVFAQGEVQERIPDYAVAYEYPSVDSIKEIINRVRIYYESTCDLNIVDSETGKEITDFTRPDKNAQIPHGFACEWSYTNGVVLSAFEYIDDVTGDPLFFANNTKFFDLVVKTIPFFENDFSGFCYESRSIELPVFLIFLQQPIDFRSFILGMSETKGNNNAENDKRDFFNCSILLHYGSP